MDASCCEFKKLMSQVLSDLKYMSNQVIKKTDILLNEVESLNVNSVDALSQSIITLFERINLNITDFSTTFNNALVKYKKAEEIKKSESTEADPNLAFPTEKEEKIQVDEDELPEMAAPVPAEKTDIEVVKIKEERDDSDLDEPTLLNFDVPVDSKANELKKALDELCSQEVKKEVTNDLFDSTSFDFDDMNDQLVAEMEKGETHQVLFKETISESQKLPKKLDKYSACYLRQREKANARKRKFMEKMTPEDKEKKRAKDRQYYQNKKAERTTKVKRNMSEHEKGIQRKRWRIASMKYREKKKNKETNNK